MLSLSLAPVMALTKISDFSKAESVKQKTIVADTGNS